MTSSLSDNVVSDEDSSKREFASINKETKITQNTVKTSKKPLSPPPTGAADSQDAGKEGTSGDVKDESSLNGNKNGNGSLPKCKNATTCESDNGFMKSILKRMSDNSAMLFRTMFVLLGVTGIVVVYFVFRAIRLRRRRSKSRKYGVITRGGAGGDMEMEPLGDGNDDDEDYTVFEMNGRRK